MTFSGMLQSPGVPASGIPSFAASSDAEALAIVAKVVARLPGQWTARVWERLDGKMREVRG